MYDVSWAMGDGLFLDFANVEKYYYLRSSGRNYSPVYGPYTDVISGLL
jgi:hypothetical protein